MSNKWQTILFTCPMGPEKGTNRKALQKVLTVTQIEQHLITGGGSQPSQSPFAHLYSPIPPLCKEKEDNDAGTEESFQHKLKSCSSQGTAPGWGHKKPGAHRPSALRRGTQEGPSSST